MAIESFDVTDENGVRVTGTVEAYHDPNGDYYNPQSEFYLNPRHRDLDINYLNTRDVCRINPEKLKQAVAEAFVRALAKSGVDKPNTDVVDKNVGDSIDFTRRQCAQNPDKYVSNQTSLAVDTESGKPVGDMTVRAYAAVPDGGGGTQTVLARENSWPAGHVPEAGKQAIDGARSPGQQTGYDGAKTESGDYSSPTTGAPSPPASLVRTLQRVELPNSRGSAGPARSDQPPPGGLPPPLSPDIAIHGAGGSTSIGGLSGPTPLMPPANSGSPASARQAPPVALTLPPPYFAPETPQSFGPFTVPSPSSSDAFGGLGAVKKPGGIPGMMIDAGLIPNWREILSEPIGSPDLVDKWMSERPRTLGAVGSPTAPLQVTAADAYQPFGTRGTGAPAVRFVPPNNPLAPASPASLADRFGNWTPSPQTGAQPDPDQPAPSPQSGGSTQVDPQKIRYLRRVDPDDIDSVSQPPGPNMPPQPNRPLGIVSGKPMPNYPVPPMLFGFSDRSTASGDNMDDFFNRWIKPLMEQ